MRDSEKKGDRRKDCKKTRSGKGGEGKTGQEAVRLRENSHKAALYPESPDADTVVDVSKAPGSIGANPMRCVF